MNGPSPLQGPSRRIEKRHRVAMAVSLSVGRRTEHVVTEDVSDSGAFLRMDNPPPLRDLIRLTVLLHSGKTLTVHGMAVYRVTPGDPTGRAPGVGVQFYALDKDTRTAWMDHVRALQAGAPAANGVERREDPRYDAELELEVRTVAELRQLSSLDVSAGGMLIATDMTTPVGAVVCVRVKHPHRARFFDLDARVVRVLSTPVPAVAVQFIGMDAARKTAFMAFIGPAIAASLRPESIEVDLGVQWPEFMERAG